MPTVAFWNLNANVSAQMVASFARESDADVVVLAENHHDIPKLRREMNRGVKQSYFPDSVDASRLTILTRFPFDPLFLVHDSLGVSIRHYWMPIGESFLVVAVHLSSKLRKKTEDQILSATRLARYIREAEQRVGHARTILVGDLNMNPFESGVVGSEGLHGIMDRSIAAAGSRRVQGEDCAFFYNPMWSMFGDGIRFPPGTYFYNSGSEVNYYWNMFDQVLIRPSLLKAFQTDSVKIVTEVASTSLLAGSGRPDAAIHSDHLPIVCRLSDS
jgi:hypothetical protein